MKNLFLFISTILSFTLLAVPSTGDGTVDDYFSDIDTNLSDIQYESQYCINAVQSRMDAANSYYEYLLTADDGSEYYRGLKTGADRVREELRSAKNSVDYYCESIRDNATAARSDLVSLALLFNGSTSNDLSLVLQAIRDFQETTDYHFGHVETNQLSCISNVQVLVSILKGVFPSATNELGQAVENLNGDVANLCIDFANFWVRANNLLEWLDAEEGNFKQFYLNAKERLISPDSSCRSSLRAMWFDLLNNRSRLTSVTNLYTYSIDEQVESVLSQLDPSNLRLSNEGVIALENLAVNQRSYLCLAELVNRPNQSSASNIVDVSWITNYLGTIQKPYYDLFNYSFSLPTTRYNPFDVHGFVPFTNFLAKSYSSRRVKFQSFSDYMNTSTNFFQRMEMYMLNLQGMVDSAPVAEGEDESRLSENLEGYNLRYQLRSATNSVAGSVNELGSVSNSLLVVLNKFNTLASSFQFPSGSASSITLVPSFQLGSVTIEEITFGPESYGSVLSACHTVFSCIWFGLFAFLAFRVGMFVVFSFGRTVLKVFQTISILLS